MRANPATRRAPGLTRFGGLAVQASRTRRAGLGRQAWARVSPLRCRGEDRARPPGGLGSAHPQQDRRPPPATGPAVRGRNPQPGPWFGARLLLLLLALVPARAAAGPWTNSIGLRLIPVPAGSFVRGSADAEAPWDERPAQRVTLRHGFLMSETEVTLEQFRQFLPRFPGTPGMDPYAAGVSWREAVGFCEWLTRREGRPYRLPTEAEWEYACRAGSTTPFSYGAQRPPPGTANAWGLKNMHTGVREWCLDRHGEYPADAATDPAGPDQGLGRVVRGGGLDVDSPEDARSAARASLAEDFGINAAGDPGPPPQVPLPDLRPGLVGRFFGQPDFTRAQDQAVIDQLDLGGPTGNFNHGREWSARFLGYLQSPLTGPLTLAGAADDSLEVWLAGRRVLALAAPGRTAVGGAPDLVRGRLYPLEIRYTHRGGEASLRLSWQWGGEELRVIPPSALSHRAAQAAEILALGTGATSERPGCHLVGFRVVQGPPAGRPHRIAPPYASQGVRQDGRLARLGPDPARPYLRQRRLLPTPPENCDRAAIDAAGLPPAFRGHNHSPALEVLPNGDVLMVLFTSYNEYEPGVSLVAARLRLGAEEWDWPGPWVDFAGVNDNAPLLWVDQGTLRLFWGHPRLASAFPFQWVESTDHGATLGPVRFPRFFGPVGPHARQPINSAFRDPHGTILVAGDAVGAASVLWASPDDGRTWRDPGGRSAGRHTTYALRRDGSILGLGGKNSDLDGFMPRVISRDGGRTWETSPTPFPALSSNQRPSLLRLASGRLFCAGDFQDRQGRQPATVRQRGAYVGLSDDDGETWVLKPLAGAQPHEDGGLPWATLGYSVARQAPNGVIHLLTSMNRPNLHFELNEAWILDPSANRPDPLAPTSDGPLTGVQSHEERYPDGRRRLCWSGGVGSDGRYLLQGREVWFYPHGRRQREATYEKGFRVGRETHWSPAGRVDWTWDHHSDGRAVWTHFWPNGRRKSVSTWRNLAADGPASRWDASGRLLHHAVFIEGRLLPDR